MLRRWPNSSTMEERVEGQHEMVEGIAQWSRLKTNIESQQDSSEEQVEDLHVELYHIEVSMKTLTLLTGGECHKLGL